MATVIDSLLVTLGLDTSGLKKGAAESEKAVEGMRQGVQRAAGTSETTSKQWTKTEKEKAELQRKHHDLQRKMFGEQEEQGKKLAAGLNNVKTQLLGIVAAFTGGASIKDFVVNTIAGNAALGRTATMLGVTAQQLSNVSGVARGLGGTAAGAADALQAVVDINTEIQETSTVSGEKGLFLARMGLGKEDFKDTYQGLINLAGGVGRLQAAGVSNPEIANQLKKNLGITDTGVINGLLAGKKGVEGLLEAREKARKLTPQEIKDAEDTAKAWANISDQFEDVKTQILHELIPAIQGVLTFLKGLATWAQAHPKLATALFVGLTSAVLALGAALIGLNIIGTIGEAMTAMETLGPLLATALAPLAEFIVPILAIGAAIAGVIFLVHDFISYMKTGKSVIDWGFAVPVVNALKGAFDHLFKAVQSLLGQLDPRILKAIGEGIEHFLIQPFQVLADAINVVADVLRGDWGAALSDAGKTAVAAAGGEPIGQPGQGAGSAPAGGAAPAAGAAPGGASVPDLSNVKPAGSISQVADQIVAAGYPRSSALAMASMMFAESGLRPGAYNPAGGHYGARGAAQWRGARVDAFRARYGIDPLQATLQQQVDFVLYELAHNASLGAAALKQGGSLSDMMLLFGRRFEGGRPVDVAADMGRASRGLLTGAGASPGVSHRTTTVHNTHTAHINRIEIDARGSDANQLASKVWGALNSEAAQMAHGPI